MAGTKKFQVRAGFIVYLETLKSNGEKSQKAYDGGEEVTLDEDQYKAHAHKLEFASAKDRDAQAAAEVEQAAQRLEVSGPNNMVDVLAAAMAKAMVSVMQQQRAESASAA